MRGGRLLLLYCLSRTYGPDQAVLAGATVQREARVLLMPPEVRILALRLLIWEP